MGISFNVATIIDEGNTTFATNIAQSVVYFSCFAVEFSVFLSTCKTFCGTLSTSCYKKVNRFVSKAIDVTVCM